MASTASLFFVAVIGFVVLASVIESLPISMEDGAVGQQQTNDRESKELAGQTDGAEQNDGSSEEVIDAGATWSSVGGIPVDPVQPGPVNPVDPGRGAPAVNPRYHPVDVPKYPAIGRAGPNIDIPMAPPLIPRPAPTEWPVAIPLTTRMRGDGGLGSFNPRMNGAGAKPRPDLKARPKTPTISSDIAQISQDKPNAPRKQPIPFPAILAVVVIGGVVVVTAAGGVAYYVATRVRIS